MLLAFRGRSGSRPVPEQGQGGQEPLLALLGFGSPAFQRCQQRALQITAKAFGNVHVNSHGKQRPAEEVSGRRRQRDVGDLAVAVAEVAQLLCIAVGHGRRIGAELHSMVHHGNLSRGQACIVEVLLQATALH